MIAIPANVTETASPALRAIIDALDGAEMAELNAVGGRAAVIEAKAFHREFQDAGRWRKPGRQPSERSTFGADVVQGWNFQDSDESGATIANDADHYAFKVRGGTITAKRVSALTIPMIDEARGRRAADYEIFFRTKLFRIKGKNALFERVGGEVTGERGKSRRTPGATAIKTSTIRAVYALVKSVTQPPWPEALPPDDRIADAFSIAWRQEMTRRIQ